VTAAALAASCGGGGGTGGTGGAAGSPAGQAGQGSPLGTGGGATGGTAGLAGAAGMAGSGGGAGISGAACLAQLVPVPVDCTGCTMLRLDITAEEMLADRHRNRLYLTVPGGSPACADSVVILDATTLAPIDAVAVGASPDYMALSDDASTLWVAMGAAFAIRKLTLTSNPIAQGPLITVPQGAGPTTASAMAVLPGAPSSVVVEAVTGIDPSATYVMDDGVARPTNTSDQVLQAATLTSTGPAGVLFGYKGDAAGYGVFFTYTITPAGISQTIVSGLVNGVGHTLVYDQGRVYATSGDVIDVSSPSSPKHAGMIPTGPLVVRDANRALVLQADAVRGSASRHQLLLIDKPTLNQVDAFTLPADVLLSPNPELSSPFSFEYAGASRVAFLEYTIDSPDPFVSSTHLFLVDTPLVAEP
jgi:hypothetical protein